MNNKIISDPIEKNLNTIKTRYMEWWIICLFFIFSFISTPTLLISLIFLLSLLKQKEIGTLKILNIIALRTVINSGLAIDIENIQNIKWLVIFLCSFYLISGYNSLESELRKNVMMILKAILAFASYNIIVSYFFSTLPVVAIFKVLSYATVFLAIIIGIANTTHRFNWIDWMYKMMATLFLFSIPFINHPIGYLRNGHSFQGLTNQPNMFGIIAGLFVALILSRIHLKNFKNSFIPFILMIIVLYMIILSKSRTGFLTTIFIIILFLLIAEINKLKKIMAFNLLGVFTILYIWLDVTILEFFQQFLYKGQENILYSRTNQVGGLMSNFLRSPWFGSGFSVPVTSYRSLEFSSEYVVEPGNLLLAVLSYGGIIGFIIFLILMFKIVYINKKNFRYLILLPISAVLISMGEMVFFSTNNIGIWIYMFLSIYMFEEKVHSKKALENEG